MGSAEKIDFVSIEDYLAEELVSPIEHEYIGGIVYAMAGARNVHNLIASNLLGSYTRVFIKLHPDPTIQIPKFAFAYLRKYDFTNLMYPSYVARIVRMNLFKMNLLWSPKCCLH